VQIKDQVPLFKETLSEFSRDKAQRLAAALAYYTMFSVAPLLVISIAIAGLIFGRSEAQHQILGQLQNLFGTPGGAALEEMLAAAAKPKGSKVAILLGAITLLFGAAGVFGQLKDAMNSIWNVEPKNEGGTPMRAALTRAAELLAEWCDAHPNSYPPTILHVTDGEATDGDPEEVAEALRQLHTADGQALLFNLHVTTKGGREVIFPSGDDGLVDEYAQMMFRMSSPLPPHLAKLAGDKGYSVASGSRGFIFNADPKLIVDFFDIGTRPRLMADR